MKLLGRTGKIAGQDMVVTDLVRIGAAPDNEFRVTVAGISRHHARIVKDGDAFWLEDAGSTNGTFLNGQRVARERLRHLDVITLGRDVDLITVESSQGDTGSQPVARAVEDAWLEAVDARDGGRVDIPLGEITIGRLAPSNVLLDSPVVSHLHARVRRTADHVFVVDLDSANGTFVNGVAVKEVTPLADGDTLAIAGSRHFRVHIAGNARRAKAAEGTGVGTPSVVFDPAWQTRLVWSADELGELEAERRRILDSIRKEPAAAPAGGKAVAPAKAAPAPPAKAAAPAPPAAKPPAPPAEKPEAAAAKPAAPAAAPQASAPPAPKPAAARPAEPARAPVVAPPVVAPAAQKPEATPAKPEAVAAPVKSPAAPPPSAAPPAVDAPAAAVVAALHPVAASPVVPPVVAPAAQKPAVVPPKPAVPAPAPPVVAPQPPPAVPLAPVAPPQPKPVAPSVAPVAGVVPPPVAPLAHNAPTIAMSPFDAPTIVSARGLRAATLTGSKGRFTLELGRHTVGRADTANVSIPDAQVSRAHAVISVTAREAHVEDTGSSNGTFVNDVRVGAGGVALKDGDRLSFGSVDFTVELVS